jgi:peptide/nickel transport system permease protein
VTALERPVGKGQVGPDGQAGPDIRPPESARARFWRRFRTQKPAIVSAVFLLVLAVSAVLAPLIAPHDPNTQSLVDRLAGPSSNYLLGTDDVGRDVLSRLLYASRSSLLAAAEATAVAFAIGVPLGMLAGFLGGWVDMSLSRVNDAVMSIPAILLALAIIGVLGPDLTNAMLAIGIVYAPRFFRVVRASTLVVTEETYVEAARSVGGSTPFILRRHVLPNILSPLLVETSLAIGFAILAEAAISFLGLGVQPPDTSWGTMLGRSTRFIAESPLLVILPGTVIALAVLAANVLGDGFRDSIGREVRRG